MEKMVRCQNCQTDSPDSYNFCPNCSKKINGQEDAQETKSGTNASSKDALANGLLAVALLIVLFIIFYFINKAGPTDGHKSLFQKSPLVGTWVNPMLGGSTIVLRSDGTGCAYGFVFNENTRDFKWHEENGRAIITDCSYWPQGGSSQPQLTPDGKAVICWGDAYYKQEE